MGNPDAVSRVDGISLTDAPMPPSFVSRCSTNGLKRAKQLVLELGTDEGLTITTDGHGPPHGFYTTPTDPPRVLTFRPKHVKYLLALFTQIDLTPFNFYRSWFVSIFFAGITATIAFADYDRSPHGIAVQRERVLAFELLSQSLTTLTAFVLGGFISYVVGAWNTRRAIYDRLMGQNRALVIVLNSNVTMASPGSEPLPADAEAVITEARSELIRFVLLASELAVLDARGHQDTERGRAQLLKLGLLHADEWDELVCGDRMTVAFAWISSLVSALARRRYIPEYVVHPISTEIHKSRGLSRDIMTIFSLDAPYPYASLVGLLVQAAIGSYAVAQGIRASLKEEATSRLYVVSTTFIFSILLQALFNLHLKLDNPFLDRRIDAAVELAFNQLQLFAKRVLGGSGHTPKWRQGSALAARLGSADPVTVVTQIPSS
jgi:hypothetical protein